jgi:hypothetical protein
MQDMAPAAVILEEFCQPCGKHRKPDTNLRAFTPPRTYSSRCTRVRTVLHGLHVRDTAVRATRRAQPSLQVRQRCIAACLQEGLVRVHHQVGYVYAQDLNEHYGTNICTIFLSIKFVRAAGANG